MKYAQTQLTRPQLDGGVDRGAGKRFVIARHLNREIVFQRQYVVSSGPDGRYKRMMPSSVHLVIAEEKDGPTRHSEQLFEGLPTKKRVHRHKTAIHRHMGQIFRVELLKTTRTLLLDEGPPVRKATQQMLEEMAARRTPAERGIKIGDAFFLFAGPTRSDPTYHFQKYIVTWLTNKDITLEGHGKRMRYSLAQAAREGLFRDMQAAARCWVRSRRKLLEATTKKLEKEIDTSRRIIARETREFQEAADTAAELIERALEENPHERRPQVVPGGEGGEQLSEPG